MCFLKMVVFHKVLDYFFDFFFWIIYVVKSLPGYLEIGNPETLRKSTSGRNIYINYIYIRICIFLGLTLLLNIERLPLSGVHSVNDCMTLADPGMSTIILKCIERYFLLKYIPSHLRISFDEDVLPEWCHQGSRLILFDGSNVVKAFLDQVHLYHWM